MPPESDVLVLLDGAAAAELGLDGADVLFRHLDDEFFDGLERLALDHRRDDLRAADLKLEAFAAHRLDQHRQVQLAASADEEALVLLLDAQADVGLEFLSAGARRSGARW